MAKNAQQKRRLGYERRMKRLIWNYAALSLAVVPGFTLFLGLHGNPFTRSLSSIGNGPNMRGIFLAWTISMCAYFLSTVMTLIVLTKNTRAHFLRVLIMASTALLMFTNLIPFLPDRWPLLANLHSNSALISSLLLIFTLLSLTLSLRDYYPALFHKSLRVLLSLVALMVGLFIFFGAKWITEGTSIIGTSVYLFALMRWLYQENSFDAEDVLSSYDLEVAQRELHKLEVHAMAAQDEYFKMQQKVRIAQVELQELRKLHQPGENVQA